MPSLYIASLPATLMTLCCTLTHEIKCILCTPEHDLPSLLCALGKEEHPFRV
jgi:hypothetical protein